MVVVAVAVVVVVLVLVVVMVAAAAVVMVVLARWPLTRLPCTSSDAARLHHRDAALCRYAAAARLLSRLGAVVPRGVRGSSVESTRSHTHARTHAHERTRARARIPYTPARARLLTVPRCVPGLAAVAARGAHVARTRGAAAGGSRPVRCSGRARGGPSPKVVRVQPGRPPLCHLVM